MHKSPFQKQLNNQVTQCLLCNHYCLIKDGQTGICGARINKEGDIYSLVYGFPVAMNPDPIEKKPLFHFLPASLTYSVGTFGCNFTCKNCQNWDISQKKELTDMDDMIDYVSPKKIVEEAIGHGCQSIAYTYNEPTIFAEYALDIMEIAKQNGLKNIWVSNGFMSEEALGRIMPLLDAVNVDLKSFDEEFYRNICGAKLPPILENLKLLKVEQIHLEVTTLLIPKTSDDPEMLKNLAKFINNELGSDTPWHLTLFSPESSHKMKSLPQTEKDSLFNAHEIGKEAGLDYVYIGNLPGTERENTYCPKCGELAIRRLGYHIERLDNAGNCPACDRSLDITG